MASVAEWIARLDTARLAVRRMTVPRELVEYYRNHVEQMVLTAGRHGGASWDFSGEPVYAARKMLRFGEPYASSPLLMPPDRAQLLPALIRAWSPDDLSPERSVQHPNATALLSTGGVGPYGERFPARSPYQMTPQQKQEVKALMAAYLRKQLAPYLPFRPPSGSPSAR